MIDPPLASILDRQRQAFLRDGPPGLAQRRESLKRLAHAVKASADELARAVSADFGNRSRHESLLMDIFPVIASARHARFHLWRWMRPRHVWPGLELAPSRAKILPQPLGVAGVVSPWNYPVNLALAPLVAALAAGNRVMIKPSELTPRTAETLAEMLGGLFAQEEVAVVLGGPEVAAAFCRLPFDHLLFTGSTEVGRKVLAATADTLTPATLELGGKSPCVIAPGADLAQAAARIATGKLTNAGQTCIAPDYVLLPAASRRQFVEHFVETVKKFYPTLLANTDYTSVINDHHYARLRRMLDEAGAAGAEIVIIDPAHENPPPESRKLPPALVLDPPETLALMRDEIFGPILPIVSTDSFDAALDFVNARPRPLALYYFGPEDQNLRRLLARTHAGGVTVNEAMTHFVAENLPFGGVGPSGMGAYHGEAGFRAFSHAKPVLLQSRINSRILLRPPYGKVADALLRFLLRG
jgi:acyl-CoA reductase-like NAD-dependent aldehyde dehydrogenase